MKLIKSLFLLGLITVSFSSCSSIGNGGNGPYLGIGDTAKTGKLSQTVHRLDYLSTTSKNETLIELEYTLHSDYKAITALDSYYCYSVVFDNNSNNGGLSIMGSIVAPDSIAPNADETVILTFNCFKDWKTAVIKYKDYNNNSYSFSIRSSDFPYYFNNDYHILKKGESFIEDTNKLRISLKDIKTTSGSTGVDENSDRLELTITLNSLVDENISLSSANYRLKYDAGISSKSSIIYEQNYTTSLPANGTLDLHFVFTINKEWEKLVFEYRPKKEQVLCLWCFTTLFLISDL